MESSSDKATSYITNTLFGDGNSLESILPVRVPYETMLNTTINSKYSVFEKEIPFENQIPKLLYFGIGRGGYYHLDDRNVPAAYRPKQVNMDLVDPFFTRLVPEDEDLSPEERANYRIRTRIEIKGKKFIGYRLKVIKVNPNGIQYTWIDPADNVEKPYVPDQQNLISPTYTKGKDTGSLVSRPRIRVKCDLELNITGAELFEHVNYIYGDPRYAVGSEWGLFTGCDRTLTGYDHNNVAFDYTEAIFTRMVSCMCTGPHQFENTSTAIQKILSYSGGNLSLKK